MSYFSKNKVILKNNNYSKSTLTVKDGQGKEKTVSSGGNVSIISSRPSSILDTTVKIKSEKSNKVSAEKQKQREEEEQKKEIEAKRKKVIALIYQKMNNIK